MASNSGLMAEAELREWILRQLGRPFLKVELTEDHLKDSIEGAKRWFSAKKGVHTTVPLSILPGQTEYELPDIVDTVTDVVPTSPVLDLSFLFTPYAIVENQIPYDVFRSPQSGGIYSSFTQVLQYTETAKRILGAEDDWRQEGRTLFIFPLPRTFYTALINCKASRFTIEQLNERDHTLVKNWALAHAKGIVGRVRSKYDGFPAANGTASLDGERLLQEASDEKTALDEEIISSGYPMGIRAG